jgi:hypothetical protein
MIEGAGAKAFPRRDVGEKASQRSLLPRRVSAAEPRRGGVRQVAALDARNADQRVKVGRELRLEILEAQALLIEVDGEDGVVRRLAMRLPGSRETRRDRAAGPGEFDDGADAGQLGLAVDNRLQPGGGGVELPFLDIDAGGGQRRAHRAKMRSAHRGELCPCFGGDADTEQVEDPLQRHRSFLLGGFERGLDHLPRIRRKPGQQQPARQLERQQDLGGPAALQLVHHAVGDHPPSGVGQRFQVLQQSLRRDGDEVAGARLLKPPAEVFEAPGGDQLLQSGGVDRHCGPRAAAGRDTGDRLTAGCCRPGACCRCGRG